jgi:hypothetical protein
MTVLNSNGWPLQPHPCPRCGKPTIFRHCDACFARELSQAFTGPLPPLAQAIVRAQELKLAREAGSVGGAGDGDEFARTLEQVRAAPEVTPAVRWWSGMCLWCAREIREQSGDEVTHMPPLARIRTCYRHRKALLALSAWLRHEKFGEQGQKGGAA